MANLLIDESSVTVALSTAEKSEALPGDAVLPRSSVRDVHLAWARVTVTRQPPVLSGRRPG